MKKRYNFMNLLRVLSMFTIVFYHMLITLYIYGIRQLESISFFFENKNMHIAKIGVCLFFMLSGCGLMLGAKDSNKHFSIKDFYIKRFKKILIPFYIVYVCYFIFLLCIGEMSISNPFGEKKLLPVSFIFTLLGMDAYLENFGVPTCSLGIGEWFLGCLILIYLLYPLLRLAMQKNKYSTIIAATAYYVLINMFYQDIPIFNGVNMYMNMAIKIYDFILGMFLAMVIDDIPKIALFISIPLNLIFVLCPFTLPGIDSFQIPIQCLTIFIICSFLEKALDRANGFMKVVSLLAAYSYEYFLVHHIVIVHMTRLGQNRAFSNLSILLLFIGEMLITTLLAILLKKVTSIKTTKINAHTSGK